jgi:hypothetical protein
VHPARQRLLLSSSDDAPALEFREKLRELPAPIVCRSRLPVCLLLAHAESSNAVVKVLPMLLQSNGVRYRLRYQFNNLS